MNKEEQPYWGMTTWDIVERYSFTPNSFNDDFWRDMILRWNAIMTQMKIDFPSCFPGQKRFVTTETGHDCEKE